MDLLKKFIQMESFSGMVLVVAALLALILVNSPLSEYYGVFLEVPVMIQIGSLVIAKPLLLWINDGLMAVFFLLVGLEIKREVLEGQLSNPAQIVLPALGAVGGMVVPALLYVLVNQGDREALNGWAIPTATDIAFALGILSLLGNRVPVSLKIFLMTLAILDDLAGILIIAMFYSGDISTQALVLAGLGVAVLVILNVRQVTNLVAYAMVGVCLWVCVLKSGVHATLAGVVIAMTIPMQAQDSEGVSPLRKLEHELHPIVAFVVLPMFAFANAGIPLGQVSLADLLAPVPLGIVLGLFVGKQLGVFGMVWIVVQLGLARLPEGMTWGRLYGMALLCGVGFTMSLFIGSLAFEHLGEAGSVMVMANRLGILTGSLLSAVAGYFVLRYLLQEPEMA